MRGVEEMEGKEKAGEGRKPENDNYSLGVAFYRTDMFEKALECFRNSLDSPEVHENSLLYIGLIFSRRGDYESASRYFKQLVEESPENIVAYNNLAVALEGMGMAREAELLYQEAQKISPLASQILANRGILKFRAGDYRQARDHLEQAIHLNREMPFALFYLGMTYLKLSMWDEAEESLERGLELSPDSPALLNNLGIIYKKAGDFQRALRCSMRAIEVSTGLDSPYRNIDDIFCIIGEWEECRKQFDEAFPDPEKRAKYLLFLGDYYYRNREYDLAGQIWAHVLEIDPENEVALEKMEGLRSPGTET
jgi:tetratricopeptide (TPR) repeat protein